MKSTAAKKTRRRIAYIQYTNPAGYPPLEHSSRILVNNGFEVLFLGAQSAGSDMLSFPDNQSISVRRFPATGKGWLQRLNYVAFTAWSAAWCARFKPEWIYASDPLSCPAALAVTRVVRSNTIYHEHDTPAFNLQLSGMQQVIRAARQKFAGSADVCILPQQYRLQEFLSETGRVKPSFCVWNCPSIGDVAEPRTDPVGMRMPVRFYYHGSLNSERLPMSVLEALLRAGEQAHLTIVGYETVGSIGYMSNMLQRAAELGLAGRVRYLGPLSRRELLLEAGNADVGLAFMPPSSNDINMAHMAGASNKPFDYLARGQMLLVSDLADWRDMFVVPGFARACNPYDTTELTNAMSWCIEHPEMIREMGEAGRRRILSEWNYERCFAPVLAQLSGMGQRE